MTVVRIPLANDKGFFVVDEEDVPLVTQYHWQLAPTAGKMYARAYGGTENGKPTAVMAHRLILNPPRDKEVDHRDGNGLNNTRANLRESTRAQNGANKGMGRNNTSGYKGVSRVPRSTTWRAGIEVNNKGMYLGSYATAEEAAHVYDAAARKYFGDFARCNFPLEGEDGPQRTVDMRDVTAAEEANHVIPVRSSTGVRNVFRHRRTGLYSVRFNIDNITCDCGRYKTLEEARDVAERIRPRIHE